MGVFAPLLLAMLAQAEPAPAPATTPPVPLGGIEVVNEEPRFVAPTRKDKIGRIWAPVKVNGKGPYRLVLATGASQSALTPRLAEALGIPIDPASTVMLRGSTGSVPVPVVRVDTLEIGDLLIEPKRLPVIPDALRRRRRRARHGRAREHARRDRVPPGPHLDHALEEPAASRPFETVPVKSPARPAAGCRRVHGRRAGEGDHRHGGEITLGNAALRTALAERRKREIQEGKLDEVFGATLDSQVGTRLETPTLRLGEVLVRNPAMTFADFEIFKYWHMTEEPTLLVGMDVLGLLDTLIIDYKRKELQLKLAPN